MRLIELTEVGGDLKESELLVNAESVTYVSTAIDGVTAMGVGNEWVRVKETPEQIKAMLGGQE